MGEIPPRVHNNAAALLRVVSGVDQLRCNSDVAGDLPPLLQAAERITAVGRPHFDLHELESAAAFQEQADFAAPPVPSEGEIGNQPAVQPALEILADDPGLKQGATERAMGACQ